MRPPSTRPAPPVDTPKLPVTGASVTALVLGGRNAVGASIVALVVLR